MVTAVPLISKTVPRSTLPETKGCPGLTLSKGELEETINFPVDPEIRTGTISLKEFLRLSVTLLSKIVCLRYSFSERSRAICVFCSRVCFSKTEIFFSQLYLFSVNKRNLETGLEIGVRAV